MNESLAKAINKSEALTIRPNFDDVVLTPEEEAEAIYQAKAKKWAKQHTEEEERKKQERIAKILRPWDASRVVEILIKRAAQLYEPSGKKFQIDSENEYAIKALSYYFSNDARFEDLETGYSLKKNLLLMGSVGTGKTDLMKLLWRNKKRCYKVISTLEIVDYVKANGIESIALFTSPSMPSLQEETFLQSNLGWCLDEVGGEDIVNDWGNQRSVVSSIIQAVYRNGWERFPLHITTNLNAEGLEAHLGTRTYSRIAEMYNAIVLSGTDRRK